ncbi:hypothetical protein B0H10DRAFT_410501 [Mycena sp. CBHHK59/15]|nr:hypothetical protein B0H10DRAFT_410501 [Mycena sp. CBHHK59/15]
MVNIQCLDDIVLIILRGGLPELIDPFTRPIWDTFPPVEKLIITGPSAALFSVLFLTFSLVGLVHLTRHVFICVKRRHRRTTRLVLAFIVSAVIWQFYFPVTKLVRQATVWDSLNLGRKFIIVCPAFTHYLRFYFVSWSCFFYPAVFLLNLLGSSTGTGSAHQGQGSRSTARTNDNTSHSSFLPAPTRLRIS